MELGRLKTIFFLTVAICASLQYASLGPVVAASERHDALIVYPQAKNVRFYKFRGTSQLTYTVDAKFPASGVIGWISYQLEKRGWEALTYDYMNSSLPSGQVSGWARMLDARTPTEPHLYQQLDYWKDGSGNIIMYGFRYRSPKKRVSDLTHLEVWAVRVPAGLAKQWQTEGLKPKGTQKSR